METKLKVDNLVGSIISRRGLQALSFSVASFTELKSQKFVPAKEALKSVTKLEVSWFCFVFLFGQCQNNSLIRNQILERKSVGQNKSFIVH